jgi:hypothetical protein
MIYQGRTYEFRKTPDGSYEVRSNNGGWGGSSRHNSNNIIDNINRGTWISYRPCNLARQIEKMKGYSRELLGV